MTDDKDNIQLSAVEDHDGILTIRGGGARRDWNGIHYKQGMSAKKSARRSYRPTSPRSLRVALRMRTFMSASS